MDGERPIRKRLRRREGFGDVRFITFSTYRRLPLLGNPRIRDVFASRLAEVHDAGRFELFAWVVMPEHVHLLLRPHDDVGWSGIASGLKNSVARRVLHRWRALDAPILARLRVDEGTCRYWQRGGGFDRNVRDMTEFTKAVKYIHRNPVDRGLVREPSDWRWSSVRWWIGERDGEVRCDPPPGERIAWDRWRGFV
jgi:putative transposase